VKQDELIVRVHREWDGWRSAQVRFGDLHEVHWFQPAGAPHSLIHAFVSCADLLMGDLAHDCDSRSAPHRLLVCILKRHTTADTYAMLTRCADDEHDRRVAAMRTPLSTAMVGTDQPRTIRSADL
jgi:hypothetical protein